MSKRPFIAARAVWRALVPSSAKRLVQPLLADLVERRVRLRLDRRASLMKPGPLLVSGLLSEAKGVSQGARLSLAAFQAAGLAPVAHDIRQLFEHRGATRASLPTRRGGGVWFLHVNAPEATHAFNALRASEWRDRYRIAYWAYELPRVPPLWVRASAIFHEIWAPSRFVVDALRSSGVEVPVRLMPHPVGLGAPPATPERATFGIPADAFAVLTLADLRSSAARKNLLGAISIYMQAFPSPSSARPSPCLIVKVREDEAHPSFLIHARDVAHGRQDIQFLTGDLSSDEMHQLIASCNLILSPHRSEGFGLSLAEALLSGVPVLATGWSGNVDFMVGMPELSIDYSLVPVRDLYRVYRARGQLWAEPDVEDAVSKLRALAASPELRARMAARGRMAIEALSERWTRKSLLEMPFGALISGNNHDVAVPTVAAVEPVR